MLYFGIFLTLAVQIIGFAFMFWYLRRTKSFLFGLLESLRRRTWHSAALLKQLDNNVPPMPLMDGWIAEPDFVAEVVRAIRRNRPSLVVELGSGASTIFLADAVRKNGYGRVVSVDHDLAFLNETRQLVEAGDLGGWCELRHAPLHPVEGSAAPLWYALDAFQDLDDIDILIVDGPPAANEPCIRGATAKYLGYKLTSSAIIFLDDASREGEQKIVKEWKEKYPNWNIRYLDLEKGCFRIDIG